MQQDQSCLLQSSASLQPANLVSIQDVTQGLTDFRHAPQPLREDLMTLEGQQTYQMPLAHSVVFIQHSTYTIA